MNVPKTPGEPLDLILGVEILDSYEPSYLQVFLREENIANLIEFNEAVEAQKEGDTLPRITSTLRKNDTDEHSSYFGSDNDFTFRSKILGVSSSQVKNLEGMSISTSPERTLSEEEALTIMEFFKVDLNLRKCTVESLLLLND